MDRTAADRVRRYRSTQKGDRSIARVEVQVPSYLREDIKNYAAKLRTQYSKLDKARRHIEFAIRTINAPRPKNINSETLLKCLYKRIPNNEWNSHIQAFFDEVSEEAIHDIVLTGVIDFEDLYLAARVWRATDGKRFEWVKEMADFTLAAPAA